jgi:hypothetical protein
MFRDKCVVTTVVVAFISMPLLTELVSSEDGFCYRHGAPDGAVLGTGFGLRVSRLPDNNRIPSPKGRAKPPKATPRPPSGHLVANR